MKSYLYAKDEQSLQLEKMCCDCNNVYSNEDTSNYLSILEGGICNTCKRRKTMCYTKEIPYIPFKDLSLGEQKKVVSRREYKKNIRIKPIKHKGCKKVYPTYVREKIVTMKKEGYSPEDIRTYIYNEIGVETSLKNVGTLIWRFSSEMSNGKIVEKKKETGTIDNLEYIYNSDCIFDKEFVDECVSLSMQGKSILQIQTELHNKYFTENKKYFKFRFNDTTLRILLQCCNVKYINDGYIKPVYYFNSNSIEIIKQIIADGSNTMSAILSQYLKRIGTMPPKAYISEIIKLYDISMFRESVWGNQLNKLESIQEDIQIETESIIKETDIKIEDTVEEVIVNNNIIQITDDEIEIEIEQVLHTKYKKLNCDRDIVNNVSSYLDAFKNIKYIIENADDIIKYGECQLKVIDSYQLDLLHEIENEELTSDNKDYLIRKMKLFRKNRRNLKTEIEAMIDLKVNMPMLDISKLNTCIEKIQKVSNEITNPIYVPYVDTTMVNKYDWCKHGTLASPKINKPIFNPKMLETKTRGQLDTYRVNVQVSGLDNGIPFNYLNYDFQANGNIQAQEQVEKEMKKLKEKHPSMIYTVTSVHKINR